MSQQYWKLEDPYWAEPMPYLKPLYQEDAKTVVVVPKKPFLGLTTQTGLATGGMALVGLLLGVGIGFALTAGKNKRKPIQLEEGTVF